MHLIIIIIPYHIHTNNDPYFYSILNPYTAHTGEGVEMRVVSSESKEAQMKLGTYVCTYIHVCVGIYTYILISPYNTT